MSLLFQIADVINCFIASSILTVCVIECKIVWNYPPELYVFEISWITNHEDLNFHPLFYLSAIKFNSVGERQSM